MKRTSKSVFFIVAVLILALAYTAFFGVYTKFGDRTDTVIRGAKDIRWGIDIRGGVDATYGPVDETMDVTETNLQGVQTIISERLIANGITDYEIYSDLNNKQVIVRFPWSSDEVDFDPTAAIKELGQTAQLEFHIGSETTTDKDGNDRMQEEIQANYDRIRQEVRQIVEDEITRIKNDPELCHLIKEEE